METIIQETESFYSRATGNARELTIDVVVEEDATYDDDGELLWTTTRDDYWPRIKSAICAALDNDPVRRAYGVAVFRPSEGGDDIVFTYDDGRWSLAGGAR